MSHALRLESARVIKNKPDLTHSAFLGAAVFGFDSLRNNPWHRHTIYNDLNRNLGADAAY